MSVSYRTCPFCEATCGVAVTIEEGQVTSVRGDADDPFSKGFICPKAHGLVALYQDGDRLKQPMVRRDGELREASWDEAFAAAIGGLAKIREQHGADAVAIYLGNPSAHSLDLMTYGQVLIRALGTKQRYSASSADQLPKMVTSALLFGGGLTVPVPDVDRTDRLLILGGNPAVSNGSLMTAPDMPGRLAAIRARGGKVIVIDPRRSETAALADEHHFIRPGTDALLLLAMCCSLFREQRVDLGDAAPHVRNLDAVAAAVARFTPERVAPRVGIDAATIMRLAREQVDAPSAACYGRIGTTCQRFGTLASWAVDLVNLLTGNLDRPGGAMFPEPAAMPGRYKARDGEARFGRFRSRVKQLPEMFGELPVATLADEILEPGDGRVRAIITIAGNPLASAPGAGRLGEAFAALDFRVAVDPYINETTRLADVILPPPGPLHRTSYPLPLYQLAVRNVAKLARPALSRAPGQPAEWEILATLAKGLRGMAAMPLELADGFIARELAAREIEGAGLAKNVDEVVAMLGGTGPERMVDLLLRIGPHGDRFGERPDGLTAASLAAQPHGVDLGPLQPRLPALLRGRAIDLAPALLMEDLPRLEAELDAPAPDVVLIGRRHLRSNNSWFHNLPALAKGKERCTLLVHPTDAARLGLHDGGRARVRSRVGELVAPVEVSDEVMPGVVSLPHGFGHDLPGMRLQVAGAHAGVNVNLLSDPEAIDAPSGNAAFNGLPVTIIAAG
jgi:anaerobic selenocysteine-containing dehydrogenase